MFDFGGDALLLVVCLVPHPAGPGTVADRPAGQLDIMGPGPMSIYGSFSFVLVHEDSPSPSRPRAKNQKQNWSRIV